MVKKNRQESFFGIHFDFHAMPKETVGRVFRPDIVAKMLDEVRPDFVQCDTKGHAGLSSYPTKVGNRADIIENDILKMWRDLTEERGIALYGHHSGLYDMKVASIHPEWAVTDENGNVSSEFISPFSPYVDEILIPQLIELANEYRLDGAWIDGECWATRVDYSKYATSKYFKCTGKNPPKSSESGYEDYREFCRQGFRDYVKRYVTAIKTYNPNFQITSNWLYSAYMPEKAEIPVDFLSGDYMPSNSVASARHNGRCLLSRKLTWDLMAWGQNAIPCSWTTNNRSTKELAQHCQEAAIVISLGGGFQFFNIMYGGGGTLQEWAIPMWKKVSEFCRERQRFCHKAEPVHQIGIIYPNEKTDLKMPQLYDCCYKSYISLCGWIDALQDNQLFAEVLMESELTGDSLNSFEVIVVPSTATLDIKSVNLIKKYVYDGGRLILDSISAQFFKDIIGADIINTNKKIIYLSSNKTLASIEALCVDFTLTKANVTGYYYKNNYFDENKSPASFVCKYGKGMVTTFCFDFGNTYPQNITTTIRDFCKNQILLAGFSPLVEVSGSCYVDVTIMEKDSMLLINLTNYAGAHNVEGVRGYSEIPSIGPLSVKIKSQHKPKKIYIEPQHKLCDFAYNNNFAVVKIEQLKIHCIIVVES
jgi:hypothetical protein